MVWWGHRSQGQSIGMWSLGCWRKQKCSPHYHVRFLTQSSCLKLEPKRNCHSVFFFYFHFLHPHSTSHWAMHFTCTISPNSHIHPVKWAFLLQFCSLLQVMWLVFGLWKVLGCITLSTVCAIPNQLFKCHHWDGGKSWAAYYIAGHLIWRRGAWAVGLG